MKTQAFVASFCVSIALTARVNGQLSESDVGTLRSLLQTDGAVEAIFRPADPREIAEIRLGWCPSAGLWYYMAANMVLGRDDTRTGYSGDPLHVDALRLVPESAATPSDLLEHFLPIVYVAGAIDNPSLYTLETTSEGYSLSGFFPLGDRTIDRSSLNEQQRKNWASESIILQLASPDHRPIRRIKGAGTDRLIDDFSDWSTDHTAGLGVPRTVQHGSTTWFATSVTVSPVCVRDHFTRKSVLESATDLAARINREKMAGQVIPPGGGSGGNVGAGGNQGAVQSGQRLRAPLTIAGGVALVAAVLAALLRLKRRDRESVPGPGA